MGSLTAYAARIPAVKQTATQSSGHCIVISICAKAGESTTSEYNGSNVERGMRGPRNAASSQDGNAQLVRFAFTEEGK